MFLIYPNNKSIFQQLDDFINNFTSFEEKENSSIKKDVKLEKENDFYQVFFKVPGYKKDEINLSLENNILSITCTKDKNDTERKWLEDEFYRYTLLPKGLDTSKITATLSEGVLAVKIPHEEKSKPCKIKIQ